MHLKFRRLRLMQINRATGRLQNFGEHNFNRCLMYLLGKTFWQELMLDAYLP
jgi:hypothetical protein